MTELSLRIHKYLDTENPAPPEVYARIYRISKSKTGARKQFAETLVPVSDNTSHTSKVPVTPGSYYMEAVLPSGEFLSGSVSVKKDETADLVLYSKQSPNEWLSWQQFTGNLQPRERTRTKAVRSAQDTLQYLNTPAPDLQGSQVWEFLTTLKSKTAENIISELNRGALGKSLPVYNSGPKRAVYRIRPGDFAQNPNTRDYLAVPRKHGVELICLPVPWEVPRSGRPAAIEVGVDLAAEKSEFASTLSVMDERLGILLGYLTSGALPEARKFSIYARDLLESKMQNPIGAAAGGYALVATASKTEEQNWHNWIRRLAHSFQNLPDGAIQWAQLRLKLKSTQQDLDEAQTMFKEAFKRGLPYYSMGMRWLLEGLEWFGSRDPEAERMARLVRKISWQTNQVQPFTMILLEGKK